MLLIIVKDNCDYYHIQQIFRLDSFIESYHKMCVAIIMADPVVRYVLNMGYSMRTYLT